MNVGEIAALYKGIPQNDIGLRTDVLENIPKPVGIKMLIRSMAPQIVAADEIGTYEDVVAIKEAVCSRSKGNIYSTWANKRRSYSKSSIKRTYLWRHNRKNNFLTNKWTR